MKSHRLGILAAVLSAGVVLAISARAQGWTAVKIPAPNGSASCPYGINNAGQVVGWYLASGTGQYHAFITGPNEVGLTALSFLPQPIAGAINYANAINNFGQIAGACYGSNGGAHPDYHGFITGANGAGMTAIQSFGTDDPQCAANLFTVGGGRHHIPI